MANQETPGYFRIGHVELDIPPTDISTNRVINDDQVATLRTSTPMFIKSGQSRWDVSVRWKAVRVVNLDGSYDYTHWINLRKIVAIFKAAPFVEVENEFLRQHFTNVQEAYRVQRMAFALRQLSVETDPSTTNVLNVTLTMSLFNYAPYSTDFAYVGGSDNKTPVDAQASIAFSKFISRWASANMDKHPADWSSPQMQAWEDQDEGVLTLKWRKYIYVPFKTQPATGTVPSTGGFNPVVPTPRTPQRVRNKGLSSDIKKILFDAATAHGLDPAIVEAQCLYESGGDPDAGRGRSDHGGLGLLQLVASTAKQLGVTDVFDPVQNANAGCAYLAERLRKFKTYPLALGAYNTGDAYILAYSKGIPIHTKAGGTINPQGIKTPDGLPPVGVPQGENAPRYVKTILANAQKANLYQPAPFKSTDGQPPQTTTQAAPLDVPDKGFLDAVNDAIKNLPHGEWWLDHYTELGAFFYENDEITLASGDALVDGDFSMFPNQFSVVMVNNLPAIPLSAMQYPTFQHVGPTDTMISISMNSVGEESGILNETEHAGIQALAGMVSLLENQFHQLRTTFRAVSSIHRTQAVFMENKTLNLLGIHGTMIRGLSTETVPDSTNLVQASLMASQYENIFEQTTPYQINGSVKANSQPLKDLLTRGELDTVSASEQQALTVVKEFGDKWKTKDQTFLLKEIFSIASEPINVLASIAVPSAQLRPDQKDALLENLDLAVTNDVGFTAEAKQIFTAAVTGTNKYQRDLFPGLDARRNDLKGNGGTMTYADFLAFTNLPIVGDRSTISNIVSTTNAKFTSDQIANMIDQIYASLFDEELLTNPAFSRQATLITNSPFFKDRFNKGIDVKGPAVDPVNKDHGCYRDLGLNDMKQGPADYLVDYNSVLWEDAKRHITDIMGTANQAANQVNAVQKLPGQTQDGVTFQANGQALPGGANSLIRMTNIPAYTMASAFPTFKLLLIEEDNTGPFFAFDNFYSYASIIDIEVIKYRDKPDTAIIQISNLANLLQHRLYDDTAAGKMERDADRVNNSVTGGLIQGGPGVKQGEVGTGGGENATGITAGKTAAGEPYYSNLRKNLTEGRGDANHRVPLKFFALQTGSKIQVRLGYSNNPDNLFPVFTGQVTEIEGTEILTITCQSFQLELMNVPGTSVKSNSRFGFNFLSGGAAFGGWSLSNGGTRTVMETMLGSPVARHFGHWQIGGLTDKKIKGFSWLPLIGAAASKASNATISKLGSLLQTGFDRSGENILINSAINIDASKTLAINAIRKGVDVENPNFIIGTAKYGIDKQSTRSVWDIIKDVSRRYPHYNLMVRDYGFPYQSDATLVFAHPLDWYYSRPMLYGEAERERPNDITQGRLFRQWWDSDGKAKWDQLWKESHPSIRSLLHVTTGNILTLGTSGVTMDLALDQAKGPMTDLAGQGPQGFSDAVEYIHGILSGTSSGSNLGGSIGNTLYNMLVAVQNSGNLTQKFYVGVDANFQALYREWIAFLQTTDPAANTSRLKPVRKYHLIDYNHIVHNSIKVDDQIYNAVKIKDRSPYKVNQNIPDQHLRVLDVTSQIEDPDNNVFQGAGEPLANAYAQSFLRDELGKMYQGELILRGVPEIEPFDVILLQDTSTGTVGPIEVETVIHSFSLENGYITIVKPRLMVLANETVSLGLMQNLSLAWANSTANLQGLGAVFNPFSVGTTIAARGVETAGAVGALFVGAAAAAWLPPAAIGIATLGLLVYGICWWSNARAQDNFFSLMPLTRFGRPWLGGLQGFGLSDFAFSLGQTFKWFDAEEIAPTIESWNELVHYRSDYLLNP